MDKLEQIIELANRKVTPQLEYLNQLTEIIDELERNLNKPTGKQIIEFFKVLGAGERSISRAQLRLVNEPTYKNAHVFFDEIKVDLNNKLLNLKTLKETKVVIDELNELIKGVIAQYFKVLNENTSDEQRHHKAICIRRDIRRFEMINDRWLDLLTPVTSEIDWQSITPCNEYIDWDVNFDFLEVKSKELFSEDGNPDKWWCIRACIVNFKHMIKARMLFLERLKVFNIDLEEA